MEGEKWMEVEVEGRGGRVLDWGGGMEGLEGGSRGGLWARRGEGSCVSSSEEVVESMEGGGGDGDEGAEWSEGLLGVGVDDREELKVDEEDGDAAG